MKYIFFIFLLLPRLAFGAISFDAASTVIDGGVTGTSHAHTVGGGCTTPIIIVVIHWYYDQTISSVTIGGSAATQIGSTVTASDGATRLEMWRRVGVSTGSNTIATTFSGTVNAVWVSGRSYCGVDQTTPAGTPNTATGTDATPTVDITSAAGDVVVDGVAIDNNAGSLTVGAGQTQRANFGAQLTGASEEAGAATVTMSWTLDTGDYWAILGASLKPFIAGGVTPRRRLIVIQ